MDLLAQDPSALAFQTPAWLDCIREMGGWEDASLLYEAEDGRRLILPRVRRQRASLSRILPVDHSLPWGWGSGGLVAPAPLRAEEAAAVLCDLAGRFTLQTFIRPNPLLSELWVTAAASTTNVVALPRLAHVLSLEGGFAQVWEKRFEGVARTAVRKAEKSAVVVECDTTGRLMPVFYDLFLQSMERWAHQGQEASPDARPSSSQADPLRKYQVVAKRLGDACRLWVAWVDGQAAAAIIVLVQGANASYWRGAMNKSLAGPSRANHLLHRHAIEDACAAGCRYYHMGETGSSTSLAQFKGSLGAMPYRHNEYRLGSLQGLKLPRWMRRAGRAVLVGRRR